MTIPILEPKTCKKCKKEKPLFEFPHSDHSHSRRHVCKECHRYAMKIAQRKIRGYANPEHPWRQQNRLSWRKTNEN